MDMETIVKLPAVAEPLRLPLSGAEADAMGAETEPETVTKTVTTPTVGEDLRDRLIRCAAREGLAALYPDFDADEALAHPELGALLRGEHDPSLRTLYEGTHLDEIVEARVRERLDAAVAEALAAAIPEAVAAAVAESEERLLSHIRARGRRPDENGTSAAGGIRMRPAVDRLTRKERALLAERAGRGETVRL